MSQDISLEIDSTVSPLRTVSVAFVAILAAHVTVDMLAALVPSTLGLLEVRLQLTTKQSAWLLGLGSLCSGLAQPVCALVSDRLSTRHFGVLGLALGGLGIGALGLAQSYSSLAVIYALGVIGIGMFHPIGASTIGQLWHERRTAAISYFFVAGMLGGVIGAMLWPRVLTSSIGFEMLPWLVVPVFLLVVVMQRSFARLEPLHVHAAATAASESTRYEWAMMGVLYVASSLRFCVNMALTYLYVRWVQSSVAAQYVDWSLDEVAKAAAPRVGNLNAAMLVGMAIGGMSAGVLVRPGQEKKPLVMVPILFAPVIALFAFLPLGAGYFLAVAAGIGFAAMIPVTIALAQQLMPRRTNLASSLMMGGAWAVAMLGPACAEYGVSRFGLPTTFLLTAATLALAGLVCLAVRSPQ